jgi:pimeloyl-ACP methyl ester carboxylesterase
LNDDIISRREFGMAAGAAGVGVVPDWPGVGRSGYIPVDDLTGEVVIEGLGKIVASLGQPAIVMTHSMSGAYGWKLIENYGQHIAKLVAIAPGPPGNIQAVSDIMAESRSIPHTRMLATAADVIEQSCASSTNEDAGVAKRDPRPVAARAMRAPAICRISIKLRRAFP